MYSEKQLVGIAKRENNTKRSYLVVNRLQGKHVPVSPSAALGMFSELARLVKGAYGGEKLLLVGFAETATAIGAALAVELDTLYMQTTREEVPGVDYLYFSESHSHATEQKLVKDDIDRVIDGIDRIVFVEDEVTTGNTILKIVSILEREYPGKTAFAVASLLNGMDAEALDAYRKREIPLHYLVKTDHRRYGEIAGKFRGDGEYWTGASGECTEQAEAAKPGQIRRDGKLLPDRAEQSHRDRKMPSVGAGQQDKEEEAGSTGKERGEIQKMRAGGWMNARRCIKAEKYQEACENLWKTVEGTGIFADKNRILVLGTEEFMYPALYLAEKLEDLRGEKTGRQEGDAEPGGNTEEKTGNLENTQGRRRRFVRFHATTRSPICVSSEEEYPLHARYELKSFYDRERRTFLYDLDRYDMVLILTDAGEGSREGMDTLVSALRFCGNENIFLVRWCENEKFL